MSVHVSEDKIYCIAAANLKGMSVEYVRQIESRFGSLAEFFNADDRTVASVIGSVTPMLRREVRDAALKRAETELQWISDNGVVPLYFTDKNYPHRLSDCTDAPVVLYSFGNVDLNSLHIVSVVGTRHATSYGMQFVHELISDLSKKISGLLVVSGLAYGIDVCAHRESVLAGVPTVGVLAHGLSTIYPAVHRQTASDMIAKGGGLVTDYIHDAPIHKGNFLSRNRIVAGMCDALIVVESGRRGGALVTANMASGYNRDVFAVPGRVTDIYSEGCNKLIFENVASMITSADDLIGSMQWTALPVEGEQQDLFVDLSPEQHKIVEYLTHNSDSMVNRMSVDLNCPVAKLIQLLGDMEFKGLIIGVPGGKYVLARNPSTILSD